MPMFRPLAAASAAAATLLTAGLAGPAAAAPYGVQAQGYVEAFPGSGPADNFIAGSNAGTGALPQTRYDYTLSLTANSDPGEQVAASSGSVMPGLISFSTDTTSVGNGGHGSSSIGLAWSDTITLVSALPAGTPVDLRFTLLLGGSLGVLGDNNGAAHIQDPGSADIVASLSPGVALADPLVVSGGLLDGTVFGPSSSFPAGSQVTLGRASVGSSFSFDGSVQSFVEASSSTASPSTHSFVNATVSVFVEALTPGVQLVAASGHLYAPPVPEPATSALAAAGLAAVLAAARRRTANVSPA